MDATISTKKPSSYREHWLAMGGERFYTLARWAMLVLLFAISYPTLQTPIWPISLSSSPVALGLWAYTAFCLLISIALFIPPLRPLTRHAYILDIVFILVLNGFINASTVLFLPFYFLPLISAAVQHKPLLSLAAGLVTALLYTGVFFLKEGGVPDLAFVIQSLMLVFIPWFTSSLAEKWGANTRRLVAETEQQVTQARAETDAYRKRLHSFALLTQSLADSMDYKQVLNDALKEIQVFAPYNVGMVLLASGQPKELMVAMIQPANPSDQDRTFTFADGVVNNMMRSSDNPQPAIVDDISQEPELETLTSLRACKAACLVPLRLKLKTYGVLLIASASDNTFTQEHLEMIAGMASFSIVALQTTQQAFDLRQIQSRMLTNEKEIRDRIASKLHDGPTQKVAQIAMNTDFIKKVAQHDPSRLGAELDKFATLAKVANNEMRMTLFELRPLTLESEGLRKAVSEYIEKLKLRSDGTQVKLQARGDVDSALELETAGVVFDIIQESVNNALKHAEAQTILIRLDRREEQFVLTIKDDGKGFDPATAKQAAAKRASFGLQNFSERAQMIGGAIEIDSAPGKGTTITLTVPIRASS